MSTLVEDARTLTRLRTAEKLLNDQAKEAKAKREKYERDFMTRMETEEAGCVRDVRSGKLYTPAKTVYGKIDDRAAFLEWARAQEGDDADGETLYEVKERKQLVSELVRERLDNDEPLPPGIGFYVKEYVSVTAS